MTEEMRSMLISQLKSEIQGNADIVSMSDEQVKELAQRMLEDKIQYAQKEAPEVYMELMSMNFRERQAVIGAVYDSIRGLGILGEIMDDPDVTEVMINGAEDIFIERKHRLVKLNRRFESQRELEIIINKFVSQAGRQVTESDPIVDTRLADGSRVNVVLPPIALNGPIVTIRRFPKEAFTMQHLIELGSLPPDVAKILQQEKGTGFGGGVVGPGNGDVLAAAAGGQSQGEGDEKNDGDGLFHGICFLSSMFF